MSILLTKIASALKEHQIRANDKLMEEHGVLLNHSTGSGKTRTILEAIRRVQEAHPNTKQLVITPASLTSNIQKEIDKHKIDLDRNAIETISFDKAVNSIDRLSGNHYSLVSVDEAHKLRNTNTQRFRELQNLIRSSDYKVLATATPLYNSPSDISPLINMLAGYKALPLERKEFEKQYVTEIPEILSVPAQDKNWLMRFITGPNKPAVVGRPADVAIKNSGNLKSILQKYVDSYDLKDDPSAKDHFPSSEEHSIEVTMSPEQEKVYKYLEGDIPRAIREKIRQNLPLSKAESAQLNAFSTGVRQASNSILPYDVTGTSEITPKIIKATDELIRHADTLPNFKGIVYSNYLGAGLEDYAKVLDNKGIAYNLYSGALNAKEKDLAVKDYNSGRVPVLLVSSSGAEGLDLKGTKLIQVLEPHFNNSKIKQVTGRGIRFNSHEHLPENERHVIVQHFLSILNPDTKGRYAGKSIDQYLKDNSSSKDIVVDRIQGLLKSSSIRAMQSLSQVSTKKDTVEDILNAVSNIRDAHSQYQTHKGKFSKLKKKVANGNN